MNTASEPATTLGFLRRSLSARTEKKDHLDSLLSSLDATIYLLLAASYYGDNLIFLLILRTACQVLYIRTQLSPTIVANLVCIITHILHAQPEGTKILRGYLHGGLICDFVGELGPISRVRLLLSDALIFGLQLTYTAISHELQLIQDTETVDSTAPPQDIEAEEAGFRREQENSAQGAGPEDGIELQPMLQVSREMEKYTAEGLNEDLILTLDLRRSLTGVLKKNAGPSSSEANVGRLGRLFDRVSDARTAAAVSA